MANWVRFADTKATILTAGLGVVLTMLMTNAGTITSAIKTGCPAAYVVGTLSVLLLIAFGYTLFWLIRAIGPRSNVAYSTLNRFAWPTLTKATIDQLADHMKKVDVRTDAWQQVLDLSVLANRKFDACGRAVKGFAVLIVLGVATVTLAVSFTSWPVAGG
ncbi:Pycsar system effector family protein [Gordonia sp. 'Campus']|uniref:Pycsar system effector family protein n=1 Tax=Gordonia sp. 'Campus' TaxID=2915824 RepID=UPI001EE44C3F|nr:Pycsar system effector family protein [Gordonia sp. 'Campus']